MIRKSINREKENGGDNVSQLRTDWRNSDVVKMKIAAANNVISGAFDLTSNELIWYQVNTTYDDENGTFIMESTTLGTYIWMF